jgi:pyridoxine 4-dehydrogenase
VDPKVPIEETIKNLKALIDEGLFDYIGLSECRAETLKRAHAVHPIAAVEIEVSLFSYEEETKKGQYQSALYIKFKSDGACSH